MLTSFINGNKTITSIGGALIFNKKILRTSRMYSNNGRIKLDLI